jgi:ATP-dependent protease Clp ATPase subunit
VEQLIAGPNARICDRCVAGVHTVMTPAGETVETDIATIRPVDVAGHGESCCFCGKRRQQMEAMAAARNARICGECLDLRDEMVSD